MTNAEAIASAKRGERVSGEYSIHKQAGPACPGYDCFWRTLFCNSEEDVVECARCGRQRVVRCNFDEEYA